MTHASWTFSQVTTFDQTSFIKLQRTAIDDLWIVTQFLAVFVNLRNSEALPEFVKSLANALAMSTKLRNLPEIWIFIRFAILRNYISHTLTISLKLGRTYEISHDLRCIANAMMISTTANSLTISDFAELLAIALTMSTKLRRICELSHQFCGSPAIAFTISTKLRNFAEFAKYHTTCDFADL